MDVASGRLARARERFPDRARGAGRDRRAGGADAGHQPGRTVAAQRPLRHRRAVQAQGPPWRRPRARDDARGGRDHPRRAGRALLPRPALQPLPLPDQGPRRAAPARRRPPHARVHHEGRLHVRPRPRGPRRPLRALPRGLRPHLRPARARVVPRGVRRRDDGRRRRPRVHGALPGRRERRRARARLRRQCGGRQRAGKAGRAAGRHLRACAGRHAGPHHRRGGRPEPARGCRDPAQGLPRHRRRPRSRHGRRPRRPPRERHQADQRARRPVPARARGRVRRAHRAGGLHRPGRHRRADPARRRGRARRRTSPAPTARTRTCAESSPAATSRSSAETCAASRRATRSTGKRSGSSPRSK